MKVYYNPINFRANKMSQKEAEFLQNKLQENKKTDIICHEGTDRDCLYSAATMADYLQSLGNQTRIIVQQNLKKLNFDDESYTIIQANDFDEAPSDDRTILCVDFSKKDKIPHNLGDYVLNSKNIVCLDHHNEPNLKDDYILIEKPLDDEETIDKLSCLYVDASAKSATSVVYRFFEALNREIDNKTAYNLFSGLVDDSVKNHLIDCSAQKGEIVPTKKMLANKNAYEVFCALKAKLILWLL